KNPKPTLMKTISSRQRSVTPLKTSRTRQSLGDGNGHHVGDKGGPAPSASLKAWLAKPKNNLIGTKWVPAASGRTLEAFNPAEASVIARVPDSDREDINRAVAAARKAFDSGSAWRRMTPSERGKLLWRIGDLILEHGDELAELESIDNGKPRAVAR